MRPHRTLAPSRRPKWRVASFGAGGAAILLTLGWVSGCSVLYDLSTEQCSSDADCVARGGVFESLVCIENLCQEPPFTGCRSNAQCIDEQGNGVEPYACVEQACVALKTPECPTVLPLTDELYLRNLRSDNPLILAGTGVIGGTTLVDERILNYDLALTEFTNAVGGVQLGERPLVMIGCKAVPESNEELDRMMNHLANEVKVPGLAAAFLADDLQRAFTEFGDPADMFFMSPLESDPTLAILPDEGLVWHVGPGADVIARAYAPLLRRTIAHLQITGEVKVATVVTTDDRFLNNTMSTIRNTPQNFGITFNDGKSVSANSEDGNYLGVSITSGQSSFTTQAQQILDFEPHVIVSAAGREFIEDMVPIIESNWPSSNPTKPFYILSPINYNDDFLVSLVSSTPGLSTRLAGINGAAAEDDSVYRTYTLAWDAAYPERAGTRGYENFYDAAYYLIYAAAAAGNQLNSGADFSRGMGRLLSGLQKNVGADDIPTALQALAAGTIQLNGTLGPPDFDARNGTRESVGSVWCIDSTGTFQADVLRYVPDADATRASLNGTFPCIQDF